MRGKWAQGIVPRNFKWVIKDRLAICERPGGYGANHRRVRRQEEIIWIRENGFSNIVSLIPSPHNLHNYDDLEMPYVHWPFADAEMGSGRLGELYHEIADRLDRGERLIVHREEMGDMICGLVAGYVLWVGLVPDPPRAIHRRRAPPRAPDRSSGSRDRGHGCPARPALNPSLPL